jgi:Zn-dependent membrane protease YugP
MSLLAILLFIGTMALSLWATIRVRQVYNSFSLLPASSRSTGADTAANKHYPCDFLLPTR